MMSPQQQCFNRGFQEINRFEGNNQGMAFNNMKMNHHQSSKKSLNIARSQFQAGANAQSVRSLQQNVFFNRYEDDCLYMNLEEEYLHKVSKRMGNSANISINKSMYDFQ